MVKKIVALSIAFVLMLAAPLYDVITAPPASPVDFGAGDGTSLVIESPEKLNELLSNIPNIETYLETNDMTTVNQNFKSFTMVEDGFSKQIQKFGSRETETYTQHVLEMCFAVDALYYHAVGETRVTESLKNDDGYVKSAERTTTEYDMEIYYSKDKVLLKLNSMDYLEEEKLEGSSNFTVKKEDKEEMFSVSAQMSLFKKCEGKWLELKEYTEEELANKLGIDLQNPDSMTEDAQYSYVAYMYANEFASANIEAINASNQINVAYLAKLGGYIVEKLQTSFTESGDTYYLKHDSAAKNEYANAIVGATVFDENNNADIEAEFNVGSTESSIYQQWELENGNNKVEMETTTTFKNLNNTVVNLKDQKITTVYEALKGAITDYLKEMSKEVEK